MMIETVANIMKRVSDPYEAGRYVVVPTLLSYQSGAGAQAYVDGSERGFIVSDGGAAMREYVSAGGDDERAIKHIQGVKAVGLSVNRLGWIFKSGVSPDHLPTYVSLVVEQSIMADQRLRRLLSRSHAAHHTTMCS